MTAPAKTHRKHPDRDVCGGVGGCLRRWLRRRLDEYSGPPPPDDWIWKRWGAR